jgi:hypothetical protein
MEDHWQWLSVSTRFVVTVNNFVMFSDIMELEIADGLKELLNDYGFTCEKILRIQSSQLASILGIRTE